MASAVIEIIATIAEAAAMAGEVAAESAVVAEETVVTADISESTVMISEVLEAEAGPEVESLVSEVSQSEISEVVSTEVEEITETEIKTEIEETVEEENVGRSSTESEKVSLKTFAKWMKRLTTAYMVVDMVGRFIESILHPAKPKKKLSDTDRNQLTKLINVSQKLGEILKSWQAALPPLKNLDLGKISIKDKNRKTDTVLVTDAVDGLLGRCQKELDKMKPSLTDTSSVPIEVSIRKLKIGLYQAIIPLDTICYLKISGEANALKLFKFPPESDCSEVKEILNKYFDMAAKTKAMHEIQNVLTQNIKDQAKKDAMEKVTVMIRPTVVFEVKTILQQKVIPKAKEIANAAARSAAKNKANSFKGEMIAYACIPIYGYIKVHQLKKQVKQEAEDAATQAANKAARDFMQSAKGEIAEITNKTVKKVYKEKKQQVRSAVKESIEIHLRKVLEASFHHK